MSRRSAYEMLRALPAVFDIRDVAIKHQLSDAAARQYCWRWGQSGMVEAIGPRAGVFYNLVVEPDKAFLLPAALEKALGIRPHVAIGLSALNHAGWTTQMPRRAEVAVLVTRSTPSFPQIDGVDMLPRPTRWFQLMRPAIVEKAHGIDVLPPEHALMDSLRSRLLHGDDPGYGWRPDADDIDPFDVDAERSLATMMNVASGLKISEADALSYIGRIEAFEDVAEECNKTSTFP